VTVKLAALLFLAVLAVPVGARAHGGIFETGSVSILSSSRAPMFDLENMVPGSRHTRSLSVGNNGTLAASWQLDAVTRGDTALLHRLRLSVEELRRGVRRQVFAGPLAALQRVDLGVVPPGDSRTYVFSVRSPPEEAAPSGTAEVDFRWAATGEYR
jgi:hypothetical protein